MTHSLLKQLLTVSSLFIGLAMQASQAQTAVNAVWPTKPVKIVVTFPPGGAPDTLARILAEKWGQATGQTFTVDNKPGAGGNIGADFVAKSAADGTTLLIATVGTHAINPALDFSLPYLKLHIFHLKIIS